MTENQIGVLLTGVWADLQQPAILWQAGVLALCLLVAWWLGRLLQWRAPENSAEAFKRGAAAYRRVVFPLLAMLLLVAGRAALGHGHSTSLLKVAIPLFGALAVIRIAVYLLRLAFARASWLDDSSVRSRPWCGPRSRCT